MGNSINQNMKHDSIREYYEKNKDWLQDLAISGDPVVRAMALVILKRGAPEEHGRGE